MAIEQKHEKKIENLDERIKELEEEIEILRAGSVGN